MSFHGIDQSLESFYLTGGFDTTSFRHKLCSLGVKLYNGSLVDAFGLFKLHDKLHFVGVELEFLALGFGLLYHHLGVGERRHLALFGIANARVNEVDAFDVEGPEIAMLDFLEIVAVG